MNKNIAIRQFLPSDSEAIITLMQRQDARLHGLDGRLRPPRTAAAIHTAVAEKVTPTTLVAVNGDKQVRGLAIPGVWEIGEDEEMRGFFLPRNGTVALTLPNADEPGATAITHALLDALESWWREQAVDGTLITWPAADEWLAALLTQRGYIADSAAAVRPLTPLPCRK